MKLRYKFVVRNVGGRPVAVAVGRDNEKFNGMIKLNPSGEYIFKLLRDGDYTQTEVVSQFAAQFCIAEEIAMPAVLSFVEQLRLNGLLEE